MAVILKLKQYIKTSQHQFIKFLVIGMSSTIIDILLLILLKEKANLRPTFAVAINQIPVIAYNFLMNKYWSFKTTKQLFRQFGRYIILVGLNYSASILFMYIFHDLIDINYIVVRLASIVLLIIINFICYQYWVYKEA